MDDPLNPPPGGNPEPAAESGPELPPIPADLQSVLHPAILRAYGFEEDAPRQRTFRRNLLRLLAGGLTAFVVTAWVLVRVQAPFGFFSDGPREVVRAQLRALGLGEYSAAYAMFSAHYRAEVPFETWHDVVVTHWRMFHSQVVSAGETSQSGTKASLEIHLRAADDRGYRARFTLIRLDGHWWIDDMRWAEESEVRDNVRI
jgi:hypothetical protein